MPGASPPPTSACSTGLTYWRLTSVFYKAEEEKAEIPARIGRQYDHAPGAAADG
jgi:hypothetical protein